jgi:transposase
MPEEEPRPIPAKGRAAMIRKVYEVEPMVCPRCGGMMKIIAFPVQGPIAVLLS